MSLFPSADNINWWICQTDTKKDVEEKILSKTESTELILDEVSRKLTAERLESIEENAEYIHESSGKN